MSDQEKKQIPSPKDTWVSPVDGRRLFARPMFVFGITLLVLVLAGAGYALWHVNHNDKSATSSEGVKMEKMEFQQLQAKVNQLDMNKHYDGAKQLVKYQDYYNNSLDARLLYVSLAVNQGENEEALSVLRSTESGGLGKTPKIAASIADQAAIVGDKKLAVQYYEKAIKMIKKDRSNPVREADVRYYTEKLNKLKER